MEKTYLKGPARPSRVPKSTTPSFRNDTESRSETTDEIKVKLENTYKLHPDKLPSENVIKSTMQQAMRELIAGENEDFLEKKGRGYICTKLSDDIRQRIKAEYANSRYRFIVFVIIVQETASFTVGSRCLWNDSTDNYVTVSIPFGDSYIVQGSKMETRTPKFSRFSSLVKAITKLPLTRREDESSKTETIDEPKTRYENTYRMEPDYKISTTTVNNIMNNAILEMVSGEKDDFLDSEGRGFVCTRICDDIKQRVKAEYVNGRFRIVVHVTIVQENGTISIGSRCLWDDSTDCHTTVTYPFGDSFIVATCYLMYYE